MAACDVSGIVEALERILVLDALDESDVLLIVVGVEVANEGDRELASANGFTSD